MSRTQKRALRAATHRLKQQLEKDNAMLLKPSTCKLTTNYDRLGFYRPHN